MPQLDPRKATEARANGNNVSRHCAGTLTWLSARHQLAFTGDHGGGSEHTRQKPQAMNPGLKITDPDFKAGRLLSCEFGQFARSASRLEPLAEFNLLK